MSHTSVNLTDVMSKLNELNTNSNNKTLLIVQCITLLFVLGKPVLMFWIKAKYGVKDAEQDNQ